MANQQLSDYIKQQLQAGKNKEEIKNELLGAGWQELDIIQAFNAYNPIPSSNTPIPSKPTSFTSSGMKQLDPKAVWLFFFRSIFAFLFSSIWVGFFIVISAELSLDSWAIILVTVLIIFAIILVLSFIWAKLTYRFYRYELTDAGFRKELGVIYKKYVTIPYDRIQNVDIYRGILARILGLSDLNIQTAGASATVGRYGVIGGGAEGQLPALSREDAERLRDELIQRARQAKNQGL